MVGALLAAPQLPRRQLRCLLGIGQSIWVDKSKITLWTQSILFVARHIYEQAGFRCVAKKRHHSFGHDPVAETWDLKL